MPTDIDRRDKADDISLEIKGGAFGTALNADRFSRTDEVNATSAESRKGGSPLHVPSSPGPLDFAPNERADELAKEAATGSSSPANEYRISRPSPFPAASQHQAIRPSLPSPTRLQHTIRKPDTLYWTVAQYPTQLLPISHGSALHLGLTRRAPSLNGAWKHRPTHPPPSEALTDACTR
ncbi:hypothetical protein H2248_007586 [Termitomyces sp. 'cryptogamus']|nr:hypothetical protein H2248_007586 [Termitomyces sp. 'cryptogamus']